MSNYKHLADIMKVCSILPIFAVAPAMAEGVDVASYTVVTEGAKGKVGSQAIYFNPEENLSFSGLEFVGNENTNPSSKDNKGFGTVAFSKTDKTMVFDDVLFKDNKNAFVGGALATYKDAKFEVNNSKFINNHAYYDGGAIGNYGGLNIVDSWFEGNTADYAYDADKKDWSIVVEDSTAIGGGAVSLGSISKTTVGSISGTTFKNNKSGTYGGAIGTRFALAGTSKNDNSAKLDIAATFEGNEAIKDGGAIYNTFWNDNGLGKGKGVTVTGHFEENKAGHYGGAIYNDGTKDKNGKGGVMTVNSASFEENEAHYGGAIFNFFGTMDILGTDVDKVEFEDNVAYVGGAFSDFQKSTSYPDMESKTVIKKAKFVNNHAAADAGAAGFYGTVDVEDTVFSGNTAAISIKDVVKADVGNSDGGGAIQVGGTSDVSLTRVDFEKNKSGARGGAIAARHGVGYALDIDTASFKLNESANFGGAIANVYGGSVNMSDVDFDTNSAVKAGGAIYNGKDINYGGGSGTLSTNNGILNFDGVNTFVGNSAGEYGGAIYNDGGGTINMTGTNTFSDNYAGKYNALNDIHNLGTLNVKSGTTSIGGGITGDGTLNVAKDATLNINSTVVTQDKINIDGAIVATVLSDKSFGRFVGDVTLGDTASLDLTVGSVGTYDIFDGSAIDIDNVDVGNAYTVKLGDEGEIVIETKDVKTLAADTGLSHAAAGAVAGLANSTDKNIQQISLLTQKALATGDVKTVERETAKLNPESRPVAQSVAASVQTQVLAAAAGRMSGGVQPVGRAGGDEVRENGFWAQGLFNKSKLDGQFHGYTRGFALGGDVALNRALTIGAGFAYNNSDVHADNRGHTEIDANTLFAYAQYKPTNWFVNGTLTYTMAEYTENVDMYDGAARLTNAYDVDSYGAQAMTGYDFASGVTAQAGLRYLHVAQEAYSNGVNNIGESDTDFLTGVAGVKYAFVIENDWTLKLRPELRAAVTYDFISDEAQSTVSMPGAASYVVKGERLDRLGGEFGIGLTALYNGVELSLMYDLVMHKDYTSQTGMIKFRGRF